MLQAVHADLEYLTRPDRIVLQAAQLGMVEVRGGRLVEVARLPDWQQLQWSKAPMPAVLPSGVAVELRGRPYTPAAEFDLGLD